MSKVDLGNIQGPAGPRGPVGPQGPSGLSDVQTDRDGLLGSIVLGEKILIQWGYYAITRGDTWEKINLNRPYKTVIIMFKYPHIGEKIITTFI